MSDLKGIDKVEGEMSGVIGMGEEGKVVQIGNASLESESCEEIGGGGGDAKENGGGSGLKEECAGVQRDASGNGDGTVLLENSGAVASDAKRIGNGNGDKKDHDDLRGEEVFPEAEKKMEEPVTSGVVPVATSGSLPEAKCQVLRENFQARIREVENRLRELQQQNRHARQDPGLTLGMLLEYEKSTAKTLQDILCEKLPAMEEELERGMKELGMSTDCEFFTVSVPERKRRALHHAQLEQEFSEALEKIGLDEEMRLGNVRADAGSAEDESSEAENVEDEKKDL